MVLIIIRDLSNVFVLGRLWFVLYNILGINDWVVWESGLFYILYILYVWVIIYLIKKKEEINILNINIDY